MKTLRIVGSILGIFWVLGSVVAQPLDAAAAIQQMDAVIERQKSLDAQPNFLKEPCAALLQKASQTSVSSFFSSLKTVANLRRNGQRDCSFAVLKRLTPEGNATPDSQMYWLEATATNLLFYGYQDSALVLIKRFKELALKTRQQKLLWHAQYLEAELLLQQNDFEGVFELAHLGLMQTTDLHDVGASAKFQHLLGSAAQLSMPNEPEYSHAASLKALAGYRAVKDTVLQISVLCLLAVNRAEAGDSIQALQYIRQATDLLSADACILNRFDLSLAVGIWYQSTGRMVQSSVWLEKSLQYARVLGQPVNLGRLFIRVAHLNQYAGRFDRALNCLDSALIYLPMGLRGVVYKQRADVYFAMGQSNKAAIDYQEAVRLHNAYDSMRLSSAIKQQTSVGEKESLPGYNWPFMGYSLAVLLLFLLGWAVLQIWRRRKTMLGKSEAPDAAPIWPEEEAEIPTMARVFLLQLVRAFAGHSRLTIDSTIPEDIQLNLHQGKFSSLFKGIFDALAYFKAQEGVFSLGLNQERTQLSLRARATVNGKVALAGQETAVVAQEDSRPILLLLYDQVAALDGTIRVEQVNKVCQIDISIPVAELKQSKMLTLVVDPTGSLTDVERTTEHSDWLLAFEAVLQQQIESNHLTLAAVSEEYGLSARQIQRQLKAASGMTFTTYLKEYRLLMAKALLESGEPHTVGAVANRLGMQDVKYFSREYKKRFGRLPSDGLGA
ncbi:MAG: helix-turn-helix transcriptional regulator [Lewinellaceae bacterium]|nr:helix-turn-helix transcriptional regulator [Lewinellaceae bacterium]